MRYLATIDPKRVPIFAAAAITLIAAALVLYVVLPQMKARRAALEERASLEDAARVAVTLAAERTALEHQVRELVARFGDEREPQESLAAAVIAQLQEVASRRRVELVAIEPREGVQIDAFEETVFDVEVVGAYADMVGYLHDVRTEIEPLVVRDLSLLPVDDAAQPDVHAVLVAAAFGETR
jgi:Tfp pilus assembly protein PilO